jgi:hypothetical protein
VGWRMRLWQNPLSACVDQLKRKVFLILVVKQIF